MTQKEPLERAWKEKINKRLEASAFLGGEAPNDEDFHAYMLMTSTFDKQQAMKQIITVTEENFPAVFKWLAVMTDKKKD